MNRDSRKLKREDGAGTEDGLGAAQSNPVVCSHTETDLGCDGGTRYRVRLIHVYLWHEYQLLRPVL